MAPTMKTVEPRGRRIFRDETENEMLRVQQKLMPFVSRSLRVLNNRNALDISNVNATKTGIHRATYMYV